MTGTSEVPVTLWCRHQHKKAGFHSELSTEENRGLLYANVPAIAIPVHVVLEDTPTQGVIITAYVPDRHLWIENRSRKSKR